MTEARSTLRIDEIPGDRPDATVLAVSGELDLATIAVLRTAVEPYLHDGRLIVLELSGLEFCDSTGLGTFVGLHRQARDTGARLHLAAPVSRVNDLLQLSGIDQVIRVFPDHRAAIEAPPE